MTRSLVLGNGHFLMNFDEHYWIRDVYFPHIGIENHSEGYPFRFGVSVDGQTHWIDQSWQREIGYEDGTLVGNTVLRQVEVGIELHLRDAIDFESDILLREMRVRDLKGAARQVRVFLHHDFHISGSEVGDTALYDPELGAIIHYKRDRYFLIGGGTPPRYELAAFATGKKRVSGAEGTWRDAEGDGHLSGNPIAQGSVDSTIALDALVPPNGVAVLYYWIAAGERYGHLLELNSLIQRYGPAKLIDRTERYWRLWLNKREVDYAGVPEQLLALYRTSLLVMRTHVDRTGAIIAATDSDIINFARDTYSYMWPRDGALAAEAFDRAGFPGVSRLFFTFAAGLLKREGYFLHKYHPDRSLASSWHPWVDKHGNKTLPIQEDETGLVVWALWNHFEQYRDVEEVQPLYRSFIARAAEFLADYRHAATGLPMPSWDLWEERRGIVTFTCVAVWAGLAAAARFADAFGDVGHALRFRRAADEVRAAILTHLWDAETGRFLRLLVPASADGHQPAIRDTSLDSSFFGLHLLGFLDADDPRLVATLDAVVSGLAVQTDVGGLARYRGDSYYAQTDDLDQVPGNPWFIVQCWHARWLISRARTGQELEAALEPLEWVARHATRSHLLPEQIHPFTGQPLAVTPLIWSHASFVTTIHEYLDRAKSQ
ncbi:MAG: glycoside hydrolase family 15 protein [Gemmatimonadota bacterium]